MSYGVTEDKSLTPVVIGLRRNYDLTKVTPVTSHGVTAYERLYEGYVRNESLSYGVSKIL